MKKSKVDTAKRLIRALRAFRGGAFSSGQKHPSLPKLLTIRQTANLLGVHPNTLREWDRQGKLRAIRLGARRDRRYERDDVLMIQPRATSSTPLRPIRNWVFHEAHPRRFAGLTASLVVLAIAVTTAHALARTQLETTRIAHPTVCAGWQSPNDVLKDETNGQFTFAGSATIDSEDLWVRTGADNPDPLAGLDATLACNGFRLSQPMGEFDIEDTYLRLRYAIQDRGGSRDVYILESSLDGTNWNLLRALVPDPSLVHEDTFQLPGLEAGNLQDLRVRLRLETDPIGASSLAAVDHMQIEFRGAVTSTTGTVDKKAKAQLTDLVSFSKGTYEGDEQPLVSVPISRDRRFLFWKTGTDTWDIKQVELRDVLGETKVVSPSRQDIRDGDQVNADLVLDMRTFHPGLYTALVTVRTPAGTIEKIEKTFSWGVVAMNVTRAVGVPGQDQTVTFGVLDNEGHTICDADIRLVVVDPKGKRTLMTIDNGRVKRSGVCVDKGYSEVPDYAAVFRVEQVGIYRLELDARTEAGRRRLTDTFESSSTSLFEVERVQYPTRIYPPAKYPVRIAVTPNRDFTGVVRERLPASFIVTTEDEDGNIVQPVDEPGIVAIDWYVSWSRGQTYFLTYVLDAPDISPALFLTGPLSIGGGFNIDPLYKEPRQWQIASDSLGSPTGSRLTTIGFELQSTTANVEYTANINTPVIDTTTFRSGAASLEAATASNVTEGMTYRYAAANSNDDYYLRSYVNITTLPSTQTKIMVFSDSTPSDQASIRLNTDGTLEAWNEEDSAQVGSDSLALTTGRWYRLELRVDSTTIGSTVIDGRIDGQSFASGTVNLANSSLDFSLGIVTTGATAEINFDDVALNNDSTIDINWPGEGKVVHLRPNGTSANTCSADANYHLLLDEITPNDATDTVLCDVNNDVVTVNVDDTSTAGIPAGSDIRLVHAGRRWTGVDTTGAHAVTTRLTIPSSGTIESGTSTSSTTNTYFTNTAAVPYNYNQTIFDDSGPLNTGEISTTDLDSALVSFIATDATPDSRVSTLWVVVEYTPPEGGRLYSSGFELQSVTTGVEWSLATGTTAIDTTTKRSGDAALKVASLASATEESLMTQFVTANDNGPFFFRTYLRIATAPSAENRFLEVKNSAGSTVLAYLTHDNTGTLKLYDEDGQVSGTTTLSTATWYRIELKIDGTGAGATDTVEARVDGVNFASSATRDLSSGVALLYIGGNLNGEAETTGDWNFDDVAINRRGGIFQSDYPGEGKIVHMQPDATGDTGAWAVSVNCVAVDYTCIDEVTPDDATTAVATSTVNQIEDVNLEAASSAGIAVTDQITVVQPNARWANSSTTQNDLRVRLKAAATSPVIEGINILTNTTTYTTGRTGIILPSLTVYEKPYVNTPWTAADLDSAQIGIREMVDSASNLIVSTLWLQVEYITPTQGRIYSNGFELQSTTPGMEYSANINTPTISTTTVRSGAASLRANPSSSTQGMEYEYQLGDSSADTYFRSYIRFATLPSTSTTLIAIRDNANTTQASIRYDQVNAKLELWNDEDTTQIGTDSAVVTTGTWYRVEMRVDFGTAATGDTALEGKLDGTSFASSTTVNWANGARKIQIGIITTSASADMFIDDVAINVNVGSAQNGYPGEGSIVHLDPNADGDTVTWTNTYTNIDDGTPNDGTDAITSSTRDQLEEANLESAATAGIGAGDTITLVQSGVRFRNSSALGEDSAFDVQIKDAASATNVKKSLPIRTWSQAWSSQTVEGALAAPRTLQPPHVLTKRPDGTNNWTASQLDSTQIGVQLVYDGGSNTVDVTALWLAVEFVPVPNITVSGGCFTDATEGTPCTDDGADQIKVAVNGTLDSGVDAVVDGAWSLSISQPSTGAILVIFRDGEATASEEATTVVKYDGSGNVDGVKMYQSQLVIGTDSGSANTDQTITVADLDTTGNGYENNGNGGDDEDVLYDVSAGSDLTVDQDADKTERLYIMHGETFRPASGGGSDTTTHHLEIDSTAVITADSNAFNVGGDFTNGGTFTANTSTVTMTGTGTLTTGSSSLHNFAVSGAGTVTLANATHTITGDVTLNSSKTITAGTSTIDMTGTSKSIIGATRTLYNLTATGTITHSTSDLTVSNTLSIPDGGSYTISSGLTTTLSKATSSPLNMGTSGTLDGTGTLVYRSSGAFATSGTINANIRFEPISSVTIPDRNGGTDYGGNVACVEYTGTTCTLGAGTLVIAGTLSTEEQGFAVTLDGSTNNPSVTVNGNVYHTASTGSATWSLGSGTWTVGGSIDFTGITTLNHNSGTISMGGTSKTITSGGLTIGALSVTGGTISNVGALTLAGSYNQTAGTFTQAANTTMTVGGSAFTLANGATWTKTSGTGKLILENGTNIDFTDNNSTKQDMGAIQIGASPGVTTLKTDLSATTVTIPTSDTFKTKGWDVTVSGAFDCQGTCVLDLTDTAPNNETDGTIIDVGGDFTMSSSATFTSYTNSKIFLNSTAGTDTNRTFTTGGKAYNEVELKNAGATNDDITISGTPFDINSTLTLTDGQVRLDTNDPNVTLAGNLSINANATVTKADNGTATWTFDGSGTSTWTDGTGSGGQDLGLVSINGSSKTINLGSSAKATRLTIAASQIFGLGSSGYNFTLTGSGTLTNRPLQNSGTLNEGTNSTFTFTGTAATDIDPETFYHLTFAPTSGAPTFYLDPGGTGATNVSGNLIIGDAINTVTLSGTGITTVNIDGDVTISANATFIYGTDSPVTVAGSFTNNGTNSDQGEGVTFDGTSTGKTLSGNLTGANKFLSLVFQGSGGEWTSNGSVEANNLAMTAGTLTGSGDVTINTTAYGAAGIINRTGGTFTLRPSTSQNFGPTTASTNWTFNDLTFGNSHASTGLTITTQACTTCTKTINGTLRVGKSGDTAATTLNAGNSTWVLLGAVATPLTLLGSPAATFTASTSVVDYQSINGGGDVTVTVATYSGLKFTPSSAENYTVGGTVVVNGSLNVGANATVNISSTNKINLDGAAATLTLAGTITGAGIFEYTPTTAGGGAFPAGGTIDVAIFRMVSLYGDQSMTARTIGSAATTLLNNSGSNRTVTLNAGTHNFSGHLYLEASSTGNIAVSGSGTNPTVNITGDYDYTGVGAGGEYVVSGTGTWTVSGKFDLTSGSTSHSFPGTLVMNGASQTLIAAGRTLENLTIENAITAQTSALIVANALTVNGTSTFTVNTNVTAGNAGSGSITVASGASILGSNTFIIRTSTISSTGTIAPTTIRFDLQDNNLTIPARSYSDAGKNVSFYTATASAERTITVGTAGSTVSFLGHVYFSDAACYGIVLNANTDGGGTNDTTVNIGGNLDFTTQTSCGLDTINMGSQTWTIGGGFSVDGIYALNHNNGTLVMNGTGTLDLYDDYSWLVAQSVNNLTISGTITLSDAEQTVAGNLDLTGSTLTPGTSTVVMTGTGNLVGASKTLYNVRVNGAGNTTTVTSSVTVSNTLTLGAGSDSDNDTLSIASSQSVTLMANTGTSLDITNSGTDTISGAGTLIYRNSATTFPSVGVVSSIVRFDAVNGSMTVPARNSPNFGGLVELYNGSGAGRTFTLAGATTFAGGLDVQSVSSGSTINLDGATYNPAITVTGNVAPSVATAAITVSSGSNTWSVSGNYDLTNVTTFNHNSGTIDMTGTGTLTSNSKTLNNFTASGSGNVTLANATHTVAGNLSLGSTTFTPGTSTVAMTGASKSIVGGGKSLNNLTIDGGGTVTLQTSDLTVAGTLDVTSGDTLVIDTSRTLTHTGATLTLVGTIDNTAGSGTFEYQSTTAFPTGGTFSADLRMNPANGNQTLSARTYAEDVELYNNSGTSKTHILGAGTIIIQGALTNNAISGNTVVDGTTNDSTLTVTGVLTCNASAATETINAPDTGSVTWTFSNSVNLTNCVYTKGSETLLMNGTGTLTTDGDQLNNLSINSASAITLAAAVHTLTGNLLLGGAGTPVVTGSTIFMTGSSKTIDGGGKTVSNLTIGAGTTLQNTDLTVSGTLTIAASQTLTLNTGLFLTHTGATLTWGNSASTIDGAGTLRFTDASGGPDTGGTITATTRYDATNGNIASTTFDARTYSGVLELYNNSATNRTITAASGTYTTSGASSHFNPRVDGNGELTVDASTNNPTMTIAGNLDFTGTGAGSEIIAAGTGTWTVSGNVDLSDGMYAPLIAALSPTWDRTNTKSVYWQDCELPLSTSYACQTETNTTAELGIDDTYQGCLGDPMGETIEHRFGTKYSLAGVSNTATILSEQLFLDVNTAVNDTVEVRRGTSDTVDSLSCTTNAMWTSIGSGLVYGTASDFNTTGPKRVTINPLVANSDIQTRLTGSDVLPMGIFVPSGAIGGSGLINTVNGGTDTAPVLRIGYRDGGSPTLTMNGSGKTLTPGGNTLNNLTISGSVTLASVTHYIAGNLDLTGSTITPGSSIVYMLGAGTTLTPGGQTLTQLYIDPTSAGTVTMSTSDLTVSIFMSVATSDTLSIDSSRTLTLSATTGSSLTLSGTISGAGTLVYSSSAAFPATGTISSKLRFDATNTASNMNVVARTYGGDVEFYNNSASNARTISLNAGTHTYSGNVAVNAANTQNVTINATTSDPTVNITSGNLTYTGVGAGTEIIQAPDTGSVTWTLGGNVDFTNGTYTEGTETLKMNGTTKTLTAAGNPLNSLEISAGSVTAADTNLTLAANMVLSGGTFTAPTGTLSVAGNWTNTSGSFTPNSGTVSFNGGGTQTVTTGNTATNAGCTGSAITQTANKQFHHFTVAGGTVVLDTSSDLGVNGNMTVTSGSFDIRAADDNFLILKGDLDLDAVTSAAWLMRDTTWTGGCGQVNLIGSNATQKIYFQAGQTYTFDSLRFGDISATERTYYLSSSSGSPATLQFDSYFIVVSGTVDTKDGSQGTINIDDVDAGFGSFYIGDDYGEHSATTKAFNANDSTITADAIYVSDGQVSNSKPSTFNAMTSTITLSGSDGRVVVGTGTQPTRDDNTFDASTATTNGITMISLLVEIGDVQATSNRAWTLTGTSSGAFALYSGTTFNAAGSSGSITNAGGLTFDVPTVNFGSMTYVQNGTGAAVIDTDTDLTFYNLTFDDTGNRTITLRDNDTAGRRIAVSNVFTWDQTVAANAADINVGTASYAMTFALDNATTANSTISIPSGRTLTSLNTSTIELAGDYINAGTFVENTGKILMDGTNSSIINTGCTTPASCTSQNLYDLEINKTAAGAGDDNVTVTTNGINVANTLTITDGELIQGALDIRVEGATAVSIATNGAWTNIVTGDLTLGGTFTTAGTATFNTNNNAQCTDVTDDIVITSTDTNTRLWTNTGTLVLRNVNATYMTNASITAYTSTLGTGTTWVAGSCGVTLSGTVYQSSNEGSVFDCNAVNLALRVAVNGDASPDTGTCSAVGGTFSVSITDPGAANIPIAIYTDNGSNPSQKATTVTLSTAGATNITGITLIIDRVIVTQENATALTNSHLNTADNAEAGIRYNVSAGNVTVESGMELHVLSGKVFTPGGNVTTTATGTQSGPAGDVHIAGTLNMGTNSLSVGGDYTNAGTFSKSATQTTTFTATGAGFTITPNSNNFANVTFNGSGGDWAPQAVMTVDEALTMTAGQLKGTQNVTVAGDAVGTAGTINLTGGTFEQRVNAAQNFGPTTASTAWTFTNLTFSNSGATPRTVTTQSCATCGVTVSGVMTIGQTGDTSGGTTTLNAGDKTWTLSGNGTPLVVNYTAGGVAAGRSALTASTSTFVYTHATSATVAPEVYNNLQTNGAGTYTVGGNVTDDFQRAAPLGSNWTSRVGTPTISGSSDFAGGSAGDNFAAYTGTTFANDQYAEGTISAMSSGNEAQVCVRMNSTGNMSVYCLATDGATLFDIFELNNGGWGGTLASSATYPVVGDRIRIEAVGTTLRGYLNGKLVMTGTDSTTTGGYPGLSVYAGGVPSSTIEDFTAGSILQTAGDITVSQGTLAVGTGTAEVGGGDISVAGTYSQSSTGITMTTATGSVAGAGTTTFGSLVVGGAATTITTTAGGNFSTSILQVPASSGTNTFDASSRTVTISGTGTPFVVDATEVFTPSTSTIVYTGSAATTVKRTTYNALEVKPGSAAVVHTAEGGGTLTAASLVVGNGSNTGTFNLDTNDPVTDINGAVTINTSGTLIASATAALTVGGSFTNNGAFTHSSGTLTMDGTGTLTTGSSTLNNLTTSGGGTITLANATHTIAGNLNLGTVITPGTSTVDMTGTAKTIDGGNRTLYNLTTTGTITLQNSNLTVSNTLSIPDSGSLNINASRILYLSKLTTATLSMDASATLSGDGRLYYQSSGPFSTSGTITCDAVFSVGPSDITIPARTPSPDYGGDVICTAATGGTCTFGAGTIDIAGSLIVDDNALTTVLDGSVNNPTVNVTGSLTTIDAAGANTLNTGSQPWTISGSVDLSGLTTFNHNSGTIVMNGTGTLTSAGYTLNNLTTSGGGTVTLASATHTLAGNFIIGSTNLSVGSSTVVMNGTGKILEGGGKSLNNLTIAGTTTLQTTNLTVNGTLQVDNTKQLTIQSGRTLTSSAGAAVTVNGTITGDGNLTVKNSGLSTGGTVDTNVTFDASSGNVTIPARTFTGATRVVTAFMNSASNRTVYLSAGTINFQGSFLADGLSTGELTIDASNGGTHNPNVNINGSFYGSETKVTNVNMGSGTWTVGGDVDLTYMGTVTHNSGTLIMNGTSKALTTAGQTFNNLTLSGSITLDETFGFHIVAGDLTLSGTVTAQSSTVRMVGITKNIVGGGNTLYNLTIDPSSTGTITVTTSDLNISNTLTVASGDTLSISSDRTVTTGVGATLANSGTISGAGRLTYLAATFPATGTISSILRIDATNQANQAIAGTNSATRTFGGLVEIFNDSNLIGRTVTLENGTSRTFAFNGGLNVIANNSQNVTLTADTTNDPVVTVGGDVDFTGTGGGSEAIISGSNTWTVSGNVDITGGTFTATSGNTLYMNGASKSLTMAGSGLQNFEVSGGSTTQVGALTVAGTFVQSGTGAYTQAANNDLLVTGSAFTLGNGTTFTKASGTGKLILDGTTMSFADNNGTKQNLGTVDIGTSPSTVTLTSDMSATNLNINNTDVLNTKGYDVTVTINVDIKNGGTLDLTDSAPSNEGDGTIMDVGGNWTTSGTFTSGSNSLVFMNSTAANNSNVTINTGGQAFRDFECKNAGTTNDDCTISGNFTVNGNLTVTDGQLDLNTNDPTSDLNGAVTIAASGDFVASNSATTTLAGNYTNNGAFTDNGGTITIDGAGQQTMSGQMTGSGDDFNNLIITNNSGSDPDSSPSVIFAAGLDTAGTFTAATNNVKLRFNAGSTYTLYAINFSGTSGNMVYLRSSSGGSTWYINAGAGSRTVTYTRVKDSNACGSTGGEIDGSDGTNEDDGNTQCWLIKKMTVTLSGNSIALGTLGSNVSYRAITSTITSSAANGYVSLVKYNGAFTNGVQTIADAAGDNDVDPGTSEFGASTSKTSQSLPQSNASPACSTSLQTQGSAANGKALSTTFQSFASATGTVSGDSTTLCILASISPTQAPGEYQSTLTIVTTAKF